MTKEELRSKTYSELTYMARLIRDELVMRESNVGTWHGPNKVSYEPIVKPSIVKHLLNKLKRKR